MKQQTGIRRAFGIFNASLLICLLCACQNYAVSINDNEIYTPPGIFSNFQVADPALAKCLADNIEEQNIRAAEQLQIVMCSEGEISALEGIEQFSQITQLGLAKNRISNIDDLASLSNLEQVDLSQNQVQSARPLEYLTKLKVVDLRGNTELACDSIHQNKWFLMPQHCK